MIPETGSRKEFKQAVLAEVETGMCILCDRAFVRDEEWRYRSAAAQVVTAWKQALQVAGYAS